MVVYTDSAGRIRGYNETLNAMTSPATSAGETVFATMLPDGEVRGQHVHVAVSMQLPPPGNLDSETLRRMREEAKTTQASEPLGRAEQAQVRAAAAWVLRRCPG